jgi:chorismate-pyruvate lyase
MAKSATAHLRQVNGSNGDGAAPGRRAGSSKRTPGILFPLDLAYEQAGVPQPKTHEISPKDIPFPYRTLLVHENDMTLTLERHFGGPVHVRALSTEVRSGWFMRRVLLVQEYSGKPVEMGAIRIRMDSFPARVQQQILKNDVPLGRVLRDAGLDFKSHPRVFLSIEPNPEMMGVFWMREPRTLYGRQTELFQAGKKVGDIVEILPLV